MSSYLKFRLQDQLFALPLLVVEEILLLPELTCIPDAPRDVLGVVNRRGRTLPVIHLAKRLGISQPKCYITDNLIVINHENLAVGIVVNQVQDTIEIDAGQIDRVFQQFYPPISLFLQGVISANGTLIPIIDPAHIVRSPEAIEQLAEANIDAIEGANLADFYTRFVGDVTAKEREIFRQRRLDLSTVLTASTLERASQKTPLALVGIGQETIGIPLNQVKEFITIDTLVPIPFAPKFVRGNISFRGGVLTLIDIAPLIDVSPCPLNLSQALIVSIKEFYVAIVIEKVYDVVTIDTDNFQSLPEPKTGVIGTKFIGDKPTTLLDLEFLLSYHLS